MDQVCTRILTWELILIHILSKTHLNHDYNAFRRLSGVTLTGDEIIGEILTTNSALLPFTVTEFGQLGSLAQHFLYGTIDAMPCHNSRMTKSM